MTTRHPPEHYARPENSIGYLSRIVFRTFSRVLERRTMEHGVSAGQWRFLRQLWVEDGLTQRELSDKVGMREPTTVVALRSLEAAGLIRRERSVDDRRKTHIFLTDHARALETLLNPHNAEVHDIATAGLSDAEVETLKNLLRRVHANLVDEERKLPDLNDVSA
ncbi:DNA-binding MarR family transcriptional regulator [Novosphingobium kunmingense]|uniref:DNA-binding MarR family transcriptional regulator n=1 Tax=Novosphingobium kunmingense TaxID=1211806 RepID=A0A2N0H3A8_9SPHN|nr:MarR family transcriptional regulator [Novosphingobium kunmingense]PKB13425.1 DNA-binding MarR family transcriptional regulator [Novosphingobium kunmingense]